MKWWFSDGSKMHTSTCPAINIQQPVSTKRTLRDARPHMARAGARWRCPDRPAKPTARARASPMIYYNSIYYTILLLYCSILYYTILCYTKLY